MYIYIYISDRQMERRKVFTTESDFFYVQLLSVVIRNVGIESSQYIFEEKVLNDRLHFLLVGLVV